VRLEDRETARALMNQLGGVLRENFNGWDAAILAGSPDAGLELGIRAERVHTVWNGALECRLLRLHVSPKSEKQMLHTGASARIDATLAQSPGSQMFGNRIAKNIKQLKSWVKREGVSCYRLYDADMPEYSFAIDRYANPVASRCGSTCRSTPRPRPSSPRRCSDVATRHWRRCRPPREFRWSASICGSVAELPAVISTKSWARVPTSSW
jgi:23S rRNA (guanine2445-N2)-methyltransferase / 23S rRNA (guanine2069-N7)-methyltransferase